MGLDFLAHAYMNEILAYGVGAASLFGVVAPNSGNQSILVKYGTEEQKRKWLLPLIEGTMESGFSMTEPENAGSNPRSLKTTAVREGDEWVVNGHKWFTSNGIDADFFIVMCRAEDATGELGRSGQMVQIIVPTDTPASPSFAASASGALAAQTTARWSTTTSACRSTMRSGRSATGTAPHRTGWARDVSSTA